MFGLFTPKCPLPTAEKTWIERRMLWFAERFGAHRMRNARVVLPTAEFLPDSYTGSPADVRRCFDRMCGYMSVDPEGVVLELLPDHLMPDAAGLYEMRTKGHIFIAESQTADPPGLIATIVHELAHEILLRGGHLTGHEPDHETTTDLLPVFLGTGVFAANATIRDSSGWEANMSWWSISKRGYLSSIQFGYAMALFAHVRGEEHPEWGHHLRPDARKTLASGLRFLDKTGDALFTPATVDRPPSVTPALVLERLAMRSATFRLAALWDISDLRLAAPELLSAVVAQLKHRDAAVRAAAIRALPVFGAAALEVVPQLLNHHLYDSTVRSDTIWCLGELKPPAKDVVPELNRLLLDADVVSDAVGVLGIYGPEAAGAVPNLLIALERSLHKYTDAAPLYFAVLCATSSTPERDLREHFGERDPDLLRIALSELKLQSR